MFLINKLFFLLDSYLETSVSSFYNVEIFVLKKCQLSISRSKLFEGNTWNCIFFKYKSILKWQFWFSETRRSICSTIRRARKNLWSRYTFSTAVRYVRFQFWLETQQFLFGWITLFHFRCLLIRWINSLQKCLLKKSRHVPRKKY